MARYAMYIKPAGRCTVGGAEYAGKGGVTQDINPTGVVRVVVRD